MPKISELTVADLRGARDMIQTHLRERNGIEKEVRIEHVLSGVHLFMFHGRHEDADHVWIAEHGTYDDDWTEFMDKVWKRVGQIPRAEVREIRSVMEALGDAIELLDKSRSEFAADLMGRLKQVRDDAGARLIEHQKAAE